MKKRLRALAAIAALALLAASCVAGTSDAANAANNIWYLQLLLGVWHGLISIITLALEFIDRYGMDVPGTWRMFQGGATTPFYDLGFLLGASSPFVVIFRRPWRVSASSH